MSTLFGKSKRKNKSRQAPVIIHENDTKPNLSTTVSEKDDNDHFQDVIQNGKDSQPTIMEHQQQQHQQSQHHQHHHHHISTFSDIKLIPPLQQTCRSLGYKTPTPIQKTVIPFLLQNTSSHILALASTGSGKTASFVLPILHHLSSDPYGIYAVILTPTRELAKQIYEQVLALGSSVQIKAALVIGGMDMTRQSCELSHKPHICIATPGRLGALLRGPNPPVLRNIRYVVLDEADRLLNAKSGFQGDVAEVLLHGTTTTGGISYNRDDNDDNDMFVDERKRRNNCQTLLFSATLTRSLESLEEMAGAGLGRLPLKKFVENSAGDTYAETLSKKRKNVDQDDDSSDDDDDDDDDDGDSSDDDSENNSAPGSEGNGEKKESAESTSLIPRIPPGLRQEYIFMPSHVRDAYLITAIRYLMTNGGRKGESDENSRRDGSGWNDTTGRTATMDDIEPEKGQSKKAKSAIIFVSTCERTALISGVLTQLGVSNVALHSLLTQNRRLASLAKFKSQQCRVLVATDVASRGLDIPSVDLVLNCELPRRSEDYIHRVGRTARAGRRGRAVSFVCERDVNLVHACEKISGREMEKCKEVTDDLAVKMLSSVSKAMRLTKMKLSDIGFDELVKKMKERKRRDKKLRQRAEKAARKVYKRSKSK